MLFRSSQFFSLLSTPNKRLFSSSSLSVIRVVSSAYLRLLIFLLAILIPVCDSFSLALCMKVDSNILLSMVVQQIVVILIFSKEKMSAYFSTPPSFLLDEDLGKLIV